MIERLHVENFGLLRKVDVEFKKGFNVITGETGTGKSILVNTISMLVGEKLLKDMLSEDETIIEGVFQIDKEEIKRLLEAKGIEADDYIVIRVVFKERRRKIFINDRVVTVSTLKEIGELLLDIHGQHEHQSLFKQNYRREIIDAYGGFQNFVEKYREVYRNYIKKKKDFEQWKKKMEDMRERIELYKFQIKEIEENFISNDEYNELMEKKKLLESAEERFNLTSDIMRILNEDENNVISNLYSIQKSLDSLLGLDERTKKWKDYIDETIVNLEEVAREISEYRGNIEFSKEEIEYINEKLYRAEKLIKKYGKDMDEVKRYYENIKKEVVENEMYEEEEEKRKKEIEELRKKVEEMAEHLHELRKKTALSFSKEVVKVLKDIGFQKPVFKVEIIKQEEPGEKGIDKVDFLFSANPDFPPDRIEKIASGGELSRVMLGIKSTIADRGGVHILIFDEIDTGIGGGVADKVGRKLKELSRFKQVLCVTHLAQIASKADHHIFVNKILKDGITSVEVKPLNKEDRIKEIARMISGEEITDSALKHAEEIIE